MQANTKLDAWEKESLKVMREEQSGVTVLNLDNVTTMAFQDKGNTVEFALSVMAPTEKKFRPKVGEYHARVRYDSGQTVVMSKDDFIAMCYSLWDVRPV